MEFEVDMNIKYTKDRLGEWLPRQITVLNASYRSTGKAIIYPTSILANYREIGTYLDLDRQEEWNVFVMSITEIIFHEFLHYYGTENNIDLDCRNHNLKTDSCFICNLCIELLLTPTYRKYRMVPSTG